MTISRKENQAMVQTSWRTETIDDPEQTTVSVHRTTSYGTRGFAILQPYFSKANVSISIKCLLYDGTYAERYDANYAHDVKTGMAMNKIFGVQKCLIDFPNIQNNQVDVYIQIVELPWNSSMGIYYIIVLSTLGFALAVVFRQYQNKQGFFHQAEETDYEQLPQQTEQKEPLWKSMAGDLLTIIVNIAYFVLVPVFSLMQTGLQMAIILVIQIALFIAQISQLKEGKGEDADNRGGGRLNKFFLVAALAALLETTFNTLQIGMPVTFIQLACPAVNIDTMAKYIGQPKLLVSNQRVGRFLTIGFAIVPIASIFPFLLSGALPYWVSLTENAAPVGGQKPLIC